MNTSFIIRPMSRNDFSGLTEVIDTSFLWLVRSLALHSVREGQQVLISEAQGTAVGFVKLTNVQVGSGKFGRVPMGCSSPEVSQKRNCDGTRESGV